MIVAIVHSYLQPYKNRIINLQEVLLFCNYVILSVLLLFDRGELLNVIVLNVMVRLSFLQFMIIIIYHLHFYVIMRHCATVQNTTRVVWIKLKFCWQRRQNNHNNGNEVIQLQIPDVAFNYSEFQESLLGLE